MHHLLLLHQSQMVETTPDTISCEEWVYILQTAAHLFSLPSQKEQPRKIGRQFYFPKDKTFTFCVRRAVCQRVEMVSSWRGGHTDAFQWWSLGSTIQLPSSSQGLLTNALRASSDNKIRWTSLVRFQLHMMDTIHNLFSRCSWLLAFLGCIL